MFFLMKFLDFGKIELEHDMNSKTYDMILLNCASYMCAWIGTGTSCENFRIEFTAGKTKLHNCRYTYVVLALATFTTVMGVCLRRWQKLGA